jgi:hypothetical protein
MKRDLVEADRARPPAAAAAHLSATQLATPLELASDYGLSLTARGGDGVVNGRSADVGGPAGFAQVGCAGPIRAALPHNGPCGKLPVPAEALLSAMPGTRSARAGRIAPGADESMGTGGALYEISSDALGRLSRPRAGGA